MRVLIQRVSAGKVSIDGKIIGQIGKGYVILLGIKEGDSEKEAEILAKKTVNLRIMNDNQRKMNLSIKDVEGDILVISQFTLYADTRKGRRPSFIKAAKPELANRLYRAYINHLEKLGIKNIQTGEFGAYMEVEIVNDGPVTIILDTEEFEITDS